MRPTPTGGGDYRGLALISTAVAEMVVPILIGVWADGKFGTGPWGLVAGAVFGLGGGMAHLVLVSRRADQPTPGSEG